MKKLLELDFSDISSQKEVKAPPVAPPEQRTPEQVKLLGINIALEPEPGSVILKDLAELTGEEFLVWASRVFPVLSQSKSNPRDFDSRTAKAAAFEQILRFHTNSIFFSKKDSDQSKPH